MNLYSKPGAWAKLVQQRYSGFSGPHVMEDVRSCSTGGWAAKMYGVLVVSLASLTVPALLGAAGPSAATASTSPAWVGPATLGAALLAAAVAGAAAYLQRKSGRESAIAAQESAEASTTSAAASQRSAKAAEDSVALNAHTAKGTARRAEDEASSRRYQDAAGMLGHDNAAIRLAGVYAMARLADDWLDQRQTCVDVLCAYLRMLSKEESCPNEFEVRASIQRLISQHLIETATPNWCGCDFDLSAARLDNLNLNNVTFECRPNFTRAHFTSQLFASNVVFKRGAFFLHTVFEKPIYIQSVQVLDEQLYLNGAEINGGYLTTKLVAEKASINLSEVTCKADFGVTCATSKQRQGLIFMNKLQVESTAKFSMQIPHDSEDYEVVGIAPHALIQVASLASVDLPHGLVQTPSPSTWKEEWVNTPDNGSSTT